MEQVVEILNGAFISKEDHQQPISPQRRTGNYHPNIWTDDFIQSLSSPYGAPSYSERVEALVKEIKDRFYVKFGDADIISSPYDLLEWFSVVDVVGRLGIDRHFQKEIKVALDYTYKCWNDKSISGGKSNAIDDLNTTALGFRVLRLNGYHVSPDVFQNFKDEKGQFFCPQSQETEEYEQLRSMLNLYRTSEISFPGEKIMREAKIFASAYLQQTLKERNQLKEKSYLLAEAEYVLEYPWRCRVPRWEAWNSIQMYKQDDAWMMMKGVYMMPNAWRKKIMEVAVLDFNILQALHQSELKHISKWWHESTVTQLGFFRHRHVEYYFWWCCGLFEAELGASRIGYAKAATLITLIDDIYDTYGTIHELQPFTTGLIKWDMSVMDQLPDYMKIALQFIHKTYMEIATDAEKIHGPRVHKYMEDYWETLIWGQLQEAEWIATNHLPNLEEYLKTALITTTVPVVTFFPMILIDTFLAKNIQEQVNKIESCVSWACRLVDDSKDYQEEQEHGEQASWIECYIKDNPGTTREEALNHVHKLIDSATEELNCEFLVNQKNLSACFKKVYFEAMWRSVCLIWKDRDGFSFLRKGTKDSITKNLIEPLTM